MSASDDRHTAKLARRAESRQRHEARQAARIDRDRKLRAAYDRYSAQVKRIWAEWNAA